MTQPEVEEVNGGQDGEGKALRAFANGEPYVFVVANVSSGDGIKLSVASECDTDTIKAILRRTLDALG